MLVLGRKPGERIIIGDDITITVVSAGSDGVRIGIDAPRSVRVHRAEVLDRVAADNKAAAAAAARTGGALARLRPGRAA